MDRTVLQIPISRALRGQAETVARDYGFSSLQELVRVFLAKLAKRAIGVSFQEAISLSSQASKRYQKMEEDFSLGKDVYLAKSAEDLKRKLSR